MKYAVMSDVHANPQALADALADARDLGCEKFLMLGDTTGYGYDVVASMSLVRSQFDTVLLGNHDSVCIGKNRSFSVQLNPNYDIDRNQRAELSQDDLDWLAGRRYVHREADAVFVHGDLTDPPAWHYIMDEDGAQLSLAALTDRENLLFCGHTHHAAVWQRSPKGHLSSGCVCKLQNPAEKPETISFALRKGWHYVVNVGSVGYPRADFCSVYVIYDTEARVITYRRLPFDFGSYVKNMLSRGLSLPFWLMDVLASALDQK